MKISAAVFDVDGTLVRRNCTYIFMRYLFDNHVIEPARFHSFIGKLNNADPGEYKDAIAESLGFFTFADFNELQPHWYRCFETTVKTEFNRPMVDRIRELQEQNTVIILASGSYEGLVRLVGAELGIHGLNILATSSPEAPCHGDIKRKMVLDLLNLMEIPLSETVFYSDNISDIDLLSQVGEGYWVGKTRVYMDRGMRDLGIKNASLTGIDQSSGERDNTGLIDDIDGEQKGDINDEPNGSPDGEMSVDLDGLNGELLDYYLDHASLIDRSIKAIMPESCTLESMEYLAGPIELSWDLETLDKNFFKPAFDYLHRKDVKVNCLGACLFLEAGGLELDKYISLLAVSELLELSATMFSDIKEWTKEENFHTWHSSRMDNAIIGNVSIAMISLVSHNLIFNRLPVKPEQKLAIYESLTTSIFNSLLGSGLKLYWEEKRVADIPEEEYNKVAVLVNGGLFHIYFDLWKILGQRDISCKENSVIDSFIEHASIARQQVRDRESAFTGKVKHNGNRPIDHKGEAVRVLEEMQIDLNLKLLVKQYINYFLQ